MIKFGSEFNDLVFSVIPTGSATPISLKELAVHFDVDERTIKKSIQEIRQKNGLIVSLSRGGYFRPDDSPEGKAEVLRFFKMMMSQAKNRFASAKSAAEFLDMDARQLEFGVHGIKGGSDNGI